MLVNSLVILAIVIAVIGHGVLLKSCGIRALCVLLALDLVVAVLAAASGVSMDSNSRLYGTIVAPDIEVTIDSNFELWGSIVARRVTLSSNSLIHYDEHLAFVDLVTTPTYVVVGWVELPVVQ